MKFFIMVLLFPLLAVFDCTALAMLVPMPGIAVLLHLAIVALGYFALRAFIDEGHTGRRTIAILAGILCLITPVLGFVVVAFLLQAFTKPPEKAQPPVDFITGNPRALDQSLTRAKSIIGEPLVYAFVHAPSAETHRLAIPLLRHRLNRKAVTLLQKLTRAEDSRTRLFAENAISASVENREKMLHDLRRLTEKNPSDATARLNLAEMLFSAAESGLFDELQAVRFYKEANHHFTQSCKLDPENSIAVFGNGMTLIRLNRLDEVPEWYGRLCALTGESDRLSARLEAELFTAGGSWYRTQLATKKIANLPSGSRRFWNPKTKNEPTGSVQRTNPVAS